MAERQALLPNELRWFPKFEISLRSSNFPRCKGRRSLAHFMPGLQNHEECGSWKSGYVGSDSHRKGKHSCEIKLGDWCYVHCVCISLINDCFYNNFVMHNRTLSEFWLFPSQPFSLTAFNFAFIAFCQNEKITIQECYKLLWICGIIKRYSDWLLTSILHIFKYSGCPKGHRRTNIEKTWKFSTVTFGTPCSMKCKFMFHREQIFCLNHRQNKKTIDT